MIGLGWSDEKYRNTKKRNPLVAKKVTNAYGGSARGGVGSRLSGAGGGLTITREGKSPLL